MWIDCLRALKRYLNIGDSTYRWLQVLQIHISYNSQKENHGAPVQLEQIQVGKDPSRPPCLYRIGTSHCSSCLLPAAGRCHFTAASENAMHWNCLMSAQNVTALQVESVYGVGLTDNVGSSKKVEKSSNRSNPRIESWARCPNIARKVIPGSRFHIESIQSVRIWPWGTKNLSKSKLLNADICEDLDHVKSKNVELRLRGLPQGGVDVQPPKKKSWFPADATPLPHIAGGGNPSAAYDRSVQAAIETSNWCRSFRTVPARFQSYCMKTTDALSDSSYSSTLPTL